MPRFKSVVLISVLLLCTVYTRTESEDTGREDVSGTTDLYLLGLGPYSGPSYRGGPALIPAMRLGIQHVNERDDVLRGYRLVAVEEDSGCADSASLNAIINTVRHVIHGGIPVMGTIGPGCSESATVLAPLGARSEVSLIQIAATAGSPALNNEAFVNTFRTLGSALAYVNTDVQFINQNDWKQIAALYEDQSRDFFQSIFVELSKAVRERTQAEIVYQSAMYEQFLPVDVILHHPRLLRIIFVYATASFSRRLLCLAHQLDVLYPRYQWIFHNVPSSAFVATNFMYNGVHYNCTDEQMSNATNGTILNLYNLERQDQETNDTVARVSFTQYRNEYECVLREHIEELFNRSIVSNVTEAIETHSADEFANMYYDAVWALALGLNDSLPLLSASGLENLANYSYGMEEATEIIREQLLNVEFEGMSGKIAFDRTHRDGSTAVINSFQVHFNESSEESSDMPIGKCDSSTDNSSTFKGTFIKDMFDRQIVHAHLPLVVLMVAFVCLLFLVTMFLQAMNFWYSNTHKPLKASSPNLTHLIFSGCYLFLLTAGLFAIFHSRSSGLSVNGRIASSVLCSLNIWATSMGYSLIFGIVCGKAWRIYRIFTHFSNPGNLISDPVLITFVVCLLSGDFFINLAWNLIDPWTVHEEERFDGDDTVAVHYYCDCDNLVVWILILLFYKGLLALIALILSLLTRRVHKKNFKSSKSATIFIYALVLLYGVGLPSLFLSGLPATTSSLYLFVCIVYFVLVATALLCLICLFLPPVWSLLNQKFTSMIKSCYHKNQAHRQPL